MYDYRLLSNCLLHFDINVPIHFKVRLCKMRAFCLDRRFIDLSFYVKPRWALPPPTLHKEHFIAFLGNL